jgi:hypothetical protein
MPLITKSPARRGAILLVVITMLVLFAVVALAFVYYAQAEATGSRYNREAQTSFRPDADPELLLSYFLGKLIYGDFNDATGVESATRGHDLARGVYGYADAYDAVNKRLAVQVGLNTTPFNGLGRVHTPGIYAGTDDYYQPSYVWYPGDALRDPEHKGARAQANPSQPNPLLMGPFVGGANPGWTYIDLNTMCLAAVNANGEVLMPSFYRPWAGGGTAAGQQIGPLDPSNPNWAANPTLLTTEPWLKGASLRPLPAYHTGVPGKTSFPPPDDPGGDVKNLEGLPGVPGPNGTHYNNDSIWIDVGFPVMTDPTSGRKYKAVFAACVVDLDGKINLNATGNIRGTDPTSGLPISLSNQGWGVWEVALWRAMTAAGNNSQWRNLFLGNGTISGRYGPDKQPSKSWTSPASGTMPHFTGAADLDGATTTNVDPVNGPTYGPSAMLLLPGDPKNGYGNKGMFLTVPYYPSSTMLMSGNGGPLTFGNGTDGPNPYQAPKGPFQPGFAYERLNHPLQFNLFTPGGDDRVFSARNMEALLRFGGTGSPAFNSDLFGLCPLDFSFTRTRLLLTTHSFDLSRPGAIPWLGAADPNYQLNTTTANPPIPMSGVPVGSTTPTSPPLPSAFAGEFQTERRSATGTLGPRINLNNSLPAYPAPDGPTGGTPGQINMSNAPTATPQQLANYNQFVLALTARQNLAENIFSRLVWLTTGQQLPTSQAQQVVFFTALKQPAPVGNPGQYAALRWLAQLAVNIVDYRDADNYTPSATTPTPPPSPLNNNNGPPGGYNTPFNWDPSDKINGWVYGVEQPQLVLNEVYAEVDNTAPDLAKLGAAQLPTPTNFQVNFWVELHNPFKKDPALVDPLDPGVWAGNPPTYPGAARLSLPPNAAGVRPPGLYRIIIAQSDDGKVHTMLNDPSNTTGDLYTNVAGLKAYLPEVMTIAENFTPQPAPAPQPVPGVNTDLVQAADGAFAGLNGNNQGYYVLGALYGVPPLTGPSFPGTNAARPSPTLIMTTQPQTEPMTGQVKPNGMTYPLPAANYNPTALPHHTLVLQRLACPYLPPNPNPVLADGVTLNPWYNPYITVDYVENVPTNDGTQITPTAQARTPTWTTMYSAGRKQPYGAFSHINLATNAYQTDSQVVLQTPDKDGNPANGIQPWPDMPQTTMFYANAVGGTPAPTVAGNPPANPSPYGANETLSIPFDWFVQIDRQLINPIEMLSVSACRPSQVTQLFMYTTGGATPTTLPFAHLAPWRNPSARLYRFLDYIETASKAAGVQSGGRRPGQVNINTLWDPEIVDALLDPQPSSYFPGAGVTTAGLLKSLLASRTPGGVPGPNDRPFLPLSAPTIAAGDTQYPGGVSINDTVLRPDPADTSGQKLLFGISPTARLAATGQPLPGWNPQMRHEVLQKIFSNITTRSNVFAVWLTVGFFEVTDDTVRPVKLGAEIGKAEGRNVRHRMFAIIDRSNVAAPAQLTTLTAAVVAAPTPQPVAVGAISGTAGPAAAPVGVTMNWIIQPGSRIKVDSEIVTVQAVTPAPPTITAVFTQNHGNGAPVSLPGTPGPIGGTVLGNPGPQQRYNPRTNEAVVLYFNIIE